MLHIATFSCKNERQNFVFWQRLAPHTRVLVTLLLVFATALTPNGSWETWAIYGLGLIILILISRVTIRVLVQRVAIEFVFIGVVLLGTLFRDGGEILWSWGFLRVTSGGLLVLGSVALKAFLCLCTVNILVLTTAIPDLLQALVTLKTPPLLVAILASMYRYLAVLIAEFNSMRRAAIARNLMSSPRWQRLLVGHIIGALFIRTYERGDRIYQAMLSRGYTGSLPSVQVPQSKLKDYLAIICIVILILWGQMVHLLR
ncbi:energy-coupling factor transporter transmembrane protein EcfT [Microcystis aeruginosa NIES-2520]|uniref:Energy-coupling factor transporter transmembrane protein EcfT n=1 Tax=Microcystis aeruginosa NIES-2520 TaxID=2303982 RepID=A0A5A5RLF9_MICAE|nr:cobalt ECF transporter T component CbiQ [Microcystis aeruginosa]MDJ0563562.1 cobalt ECF transporter T component CbiQ [Microcystis sp. M49629_WE12]NCR77758.1 cobalt ECF transporter T component CbiQ [Microcystis aeruginosa K13-06]GCA76940.1 energy-coupling factor transporter transmembrane protein EcfT [Microcystis aeruginosa NIES-2520]